MAILSGLVDARKRRRMAQGLLGHPDLERCTIYFSFYLFRGAARAETQPTRSSIGWALWFELKANGLRTPVGAAGANAQ
ncbi:MAG: hypothetical protein KatS3mg052_2500 [Candidatus Roseilinea sp.]|nr:MAG: hypothetical protein KatS3mg052_2500 [Candidatus Roseilinea sp.]